MRQRDVAHVGTLKGVSKIHLLSQCHH